MNWIFGFKGRINRAKFWGGNLVINLVLYLVSALLGVVTALAQGQFGIALLVVTVLSAAILIIYLFFTFGLTIRRLHDLDKGGWWSLLGFVPFANIYLFIITGFFRGTEGINEFGPDPLGPSDSNMI